MYGFHGRWILRAAALGVGLLALTHPAAAQRWGGRGGNWWPPPAPPTRDIFPGDTFTFCTVAYRSFTSERLGFGWNTDYPDAGANFMERLAELTTIKITRTDYGEPSQVVVRLTDPQLFDYPHIFMSDVGTANFDEKECEHLREYLLRGGFLHVDDFWGEYAWDKWEYEMSKVLPPDRYPIKDIPLDHPIFNIVFDVREVPQVPSIQYWEMSGGGHQEDHGSDTSVPHLRGIWDPTSGRLMVVMSHNTDIADGWEKEGQAIEYFEQYSVKMSYPLGINIVVYAMTH